jgi:Flp pilus assembly CpaF family ATPase
LIYNRTIITFKNKYILKIIAQNGDIMTRNKYEYYNSDFHKIIENINKKNLTIKDISELVIKNHPTDKSQIIKDLLKLNNIEKIIYKNEIIEEEKKQLYKFLEKNGSDYIINYFMGYRQLTKLFEQKNIEEIIINDYDKVFIIDREQKKTLTGITFKEKEYDKLVDVFKNTVKRDFKKREFIDGSLPDRSRLNIVSKAVCGFNAITIRKFTKKPLTIIDLIKSEVLDAYNAAYLWTVIEGFKVKPANLFVCGGTGSGKTTFLNVLMDFISDNERIILIEDTAEIDISNFNDSVSLISDISNEESLYEITINTLRMRPDRVIIGEVRAREVQGLFVAMDTGHEGCMATIHANNSEDAIIKLLNKPMEIPETALPLLDLIVILKKKFVSGKTVRKLSQITEISKVGNINLNNIYKDDECKDCSVDIMTSHFAEKLCNLVSISKTEFKKIIDYRAGLFEQICKTKPDISREDLKTILHSPELDYLKILKK